MYPARILGLALVAAALGQATYLSPDRLPHDVRSVDRRADKDSSSSADGGLVGSLVPVKTTAVATTKGGTTATASADSSTDKPSQTSKDKDPKTSDATTDQKPAGSDPTPSDSAPRTTDQPVPTPTPSGGGGGGGSSSNDPNNNNNNNSDDSNTDDGSGNPGNSSPTDPASTPQPTGGSGGSPPPAEQTATITPSIVVMTQTAVITTTNSNGDPTVVTTTTKTTTTPDLSNMGASPANAGMSPTTRNTVIGVVVGVAGAIVIGALAFVAWRIWGRRRGGDDDDGLMGYDPAMHGMDKSDGSSSISGSMSRNPFQSTLETYHRPAPVNTSANF